MTDHASVSSDAVDAAGGRGCVAVVGAGAMGSGIAQVAAQAGHDVILVDAREGAAQAAVERLGATLGTLAGKGRITQEDADAARSRLSCVDDLRSLPSCRLVVEAVVEDLEAKREIFATLASRQDADTILASNTSSLSITAIAEGIAHPERIIGLHFFNPPPLMRLVEVVRGARSGADTMTEAVELMTAWGKTPVRCTSTPGFIVNRVARPFYGEAQRMVQEGICSAATVDEALRQAGFRMGPLELTDLIGQDVNLAVGTSVWEQTDHDPRYEPTAFQQDLVAQGALGRKTGHGVYRYDDAGKPLDAEPDLAAVTALVGGPVRTDPVARTVAMLVNEAVAVVARGEAAPEDVDTAMRLGTNYPRGPIEWGREIGLDVVGAQLEELAAIYPTGRYRPSKGLHLPQVVTPAGVSTPG
ncbi:3-hydroxyacyl-CoA dehydrogenase NAD-binding domain-containing protein [Arsenicicoccus sp. oral taxon 190]|uniref:3-hydroxyacyl-CoA dehydrogenase NAD-binding domain-containing protein n=1 Tax=Arsenicicoccus sp. oral taxon 190 TaxID=1658671 RepID=UPI00067A18EC|nr:3-hydroxyacyl-CoA dehydrogenase NAD-binding domain-containing protein [Arsenicicoccus sp. oral taxon 190]AKT50590.1 3-hydroxyacyl-CoA dehydrogenase [Arsenicicoccus sp. oral taxon 190]